MKSNSSFACNRHKTADGSILGTHKDDGRFYREGKLGANTIFVSLCAVWKTKTHQSSLGITPLKTTLIPRQCLHAPLLVFIVTRGCG